MSGRACAAMLLWALAAAAALAQEPTPIPITDKAPVVLDGRVLFEVGESGTWSPQQRAREINRVLRAAADDTEPVNVVLAEHDGYPTVRMSDWHLLTVMDSDVLPGMAPGEQAQRWLQTVEAALLQARQERTAAYRTRAAVELLGVALLAALLHWLLSRLSHRLPIWLTRRGAHGRSPTGDRPGWQFAIELVCMAAQALTWVSALAFAAQVFPVARQLRYDLATLVGGSLRAPLFTMNERGYSALDLLWVLGAVIVLWITVSVFTRGVSGRLQRATGLSRGALLPLATSIKYGLIGVGLIVILQVAGLNLSSLALFASVIGVGIGFGLQSIANNFVSGLILSFERPIKPGDYVKLGELEGTVQRIGARSTIIRTPDRVSIIVPNSRLLESAVVNWSYGDDLARMHLPIGVAYGSDVDAVRAALLGAAKLHPSVLSDPRPEVRLVGFGDNALNFELLVWTQDPAGQQQLTSDLLYRIEANLRGAGIEIPFPQRTLHVSAVEMDALAERFGRPGARRAVPIYDSHGEPALIQPDGAPIHHAPPNPSSATEPNRSVDLHALVARMRGPDGLAIEERRHLLSVYPKCFVGSDAVEWLMRATELTRDEAIRLGQSLVERGVIHHVLDEHPFRDGHFFYRFYADE